MHHALTMLIHAKRSSHRINGFVYCSLLSLLLFSLQIKYHTTAIEENPVNVIQIGCFSSSAIRRTCNVRHFDFLFVCEKSNPKNIHFIHFVCNPLKKKKKSIIHALGWLRCVFAMMMNGTDSELILENYFFFLRGRNDDFSR